MDDMNRKKVLSGAIIFVAAAVTVTTVVLAAGGPGGGGGGRMGGGGQMGVVERSESVINVKLATPERGTIERTTDFIGKIEPGDDISVYPESSGKIASLYFDVGDRVNAGDLMMVLDTSDLEFSLEKAQASYDQQVVSANKSLGSDYTSKLISAQNSLDKANRSYRTARQNYATEAEIEDDDLEKADDLRNAKKEAKDAALQAYRDLKNQTGEDYDINDEVAALWKAYQDAYQEYVEADDDYYYLVDQYDDSTSTAVASKDNAYKDVQEAKQSLELTAGTAFEEEKAVIEAQLRSAALNLTEAERAIEKAYLYAPISGTIQTRSVDDYGMANSGTAAFTISNNTQTAVKFNASSDGAAALTLGDRITVTRGSTQYYAVVTEIDATADSSTGLFPITANILEGDETLLSGISVKVTASTAKSENALLVSQNYVYYDEGQAYVYTYSDGKAHRADITTGLSNATMIAVTDGLDESSQVITTWHPDLGDGVEVHLSASDAQNASDSAAAAQPDSQPDAAAGGNAQPNGQPDAAAGGEQPGAQGAERPAQAQDARQADVTTASSDAPSEPAQPAPDAAAVTTAPDANGVITTPDAAQTAPDETQEA